MTDDFESAMNDISIQWQSETNAKSFLVNSDACNLENPEICESCQ